MRNGNVQRGVGRKAAALMVAGLAAGCSSDATRFAEAPFGNPFQARASDPAVTGSLGNPSSAGQAPSGQPFPSVNSQPLPPIGAKGAPPKVAALSTAALPARPPVTGATAGWTAAGGTPVTLAAGESVETLSQRYGVPATAILSVNGLANAGQARPGQQIIIPAYNTVSGGRPLVPLKAAAPALAGRTPADAKPVLRSAALGAAPVRSADKRAAEEADAAKSVKSATKQAPESARAVAPRDPAKPIRTIELAKPAQPVAPESKVEAPAKVDVAKVDPAPKAETADEKSSADFRWPARGRVISGFGVKGPAGSNEGINIAVPEGTPVKAAEGGTVVHADDRLKGYGKLVLIRHENGYVSAYAHNGEIMVKRGDSVKRGQQIAKSGQTGNVTSPQLHFELRKGSTPVDPIKYLDN